MRVEANRPYYEGSTLDYETQAPEITFDTEKIALAAGKLATMVVLAPQAAHVMPEGELLTLEAAIAAVNTADAAKFRENASNN